MVWRDMAPTGVFWQAVLVVWLMVAGVAARAQTDVVRYGVYVNPPKVFVDDRGEPAGIFVDLIQQVAQREGWVLQPVQCEWQACLDALDRGELDLMPDVAYSAARDERFDFHQTPALHSWSQLYARRGTRVESVQDLAGQRLAVLTGSVQERALRDLLESFGLQAEWVTVGSLPEGFEAVARGRADLVAVNHLFGNREAPVYDLVGTPVQFNPAALYFAAPQDRQAGLLRAIDRYLQAWKADPQSVYFQTLRRWDAPVATAPVAQTVLWALGVALALLATALLLAAWLRRQVARQTQHVRASEARLNTILDSVEAAIFIKDPQGRYQYVNRKTRDLFRQPQEAILGHTDADFFVTESLPYIQQDDRPVFERGETVSAEERIRLKGEAQTRTFLTVKLPLRDAEGRIQALCGISTDLTEYRHIQAEIHQLAFFDPLTALPNRRLLIDRLHRALATFERNRLDGALLFIDLDNFKTLNDTLGHDMGDLLLQQMAQRLRAQVREEDTLARLGGDEFVAMLTELHPDPLEAARRAEHVAHKLLVTLAQPYDLQGHAYGCTVSVGVALFSDAGGLVEDILKRADMAMYEAKAQGRNMVRFFNPEMQHHVEARAALEADLREALSRGQFRLHYQPQVDAGGQVSGAEALLRWTHDRRGEVPPAQFIGVAEASGLILPLGKWILQEACEQLVRWSHRPETAGWRLAVNVSARQFRHPDFVAEVTSVLEATGAPAHLLELELTESQLLDDVDAVIAKMSVLRARGVKFSLDDFGTGYSSLSYLKRLPLYKLKIDQSFVRDLLVDTNDAAIVRTVVALARSLDLGVIAEGVETDAQRAALVQAGCLEYQGYLFARPMPAAELEAWAARRAT